MITAQSFTPVNLDGTPASTAQLESLEQALRYLQQDARAASLLEQTVESGVTIKFSSQMNGSYTRSSHHIEWNPEFSLGVKNGADTGYISPALVLLHEAAHAIDEQERIRYIAEGVPCPSYENTCIIPGNPDDVKMYTNREKFAVETEQAIASRLGEPTRQFYTDVIGDKTVPSVLHSDRQYTINGKLFQETSIGHSREADSSIYTKVQTVSSNGVIESRDTSKFDDRFQKISQTIDTYDYTQGTITTITRDYQNRDANNEPSVTQSITDLNGNPISLQDRQDHSFNGSYIPQQASEPFNDSALNRYFAAVMAGNSKLADQAVIDFAQSPQGQEMAQQGQQLLAEQQKQQQQEQQLAQMQPAPVMKM